MDSEFSPQTRYSGGSRLTTKLRMILKCRVPLNLIYICTLYVCGISNMQRTFTPAADLEVLAMQNFPGFVNKKSTNPEYKVVLSKSKNSMKSVKNRLCSALP